jgi:hypothetical protein
VTTLRAPGELSVLRRVKRSASIRIVPSSAPGIIEPMMT